MRLATKWLYFALVFMIPSLILAFLSNGHSHDLTEYSDLLLALTLFCVGISLGIDYERKEGTWFKAVVKK